jgi:hypothetical protein
MIRYVDLDLHKEFIQMCILDENGKVIEEGRNPSVPLAQAPLLPIRSRISPHTSLGLLPIHL